MVFVLRDDSFEAWCWDQFEDLAWLSFVRLVLAFV